MYRTAFVAMGLLSFTATLEARQVGRDQDSRESRNGRQPIHRFYGDVDCDGYRDNVTFNSRTGVWAAETDRGRRRILARWSDQTTWEHPQVADVDGDYCDDLIGMSTGDSTRRQGNWWVTQMGTADLETRLWGILATQAGNGRRVNWQVDAYDYNRDHLVDLVATNNYGETWVAYSNGYHFNFARVRR